MGRLIVTATLLGCAPACAAERPLEIVKRALEAHGGRKALVRVEKLSRRGELTVLRGPEKIVLKEELSVSFPNQLTRKALLPSGIELTETIDGGAGKWSSGGAEKPLPAVRIAELRRDLELLRLMLLHPLADRKQYQLSWATEKRKDKARASLIVSRKDMEIARLTFDRETGLLVGMVTSIKLGEEKVKREYRYMKHEPYLGLMLPSMIETWEGGKMVEKVEVNSY